MSTPEGWPVDIDLRVDFAHGDAVSQLRTAFDANRARRLLFRAARVEDRDVALSLADEAVQLAPEWDRIWKGAAELAWRHDDSARAERFHRRFRQLNPKWASVSPLVRESSR